MTFFAAWVHTPLATAAGWTLLHSLWEGAVIAAVLAATLAVVRPSRLRYAAAGLAMFAMLAGFGVTFARVMPGARIQRLTVDRPRATPAPNRLEEGPRVTEGLAQRVIPWLAPFWTAGVLLFYLRHLAGWMAAQHLRRTGVCCASDFWQERLDRLGASLRLSRPVTLLESALAEVPLVIGHLSPVILMPVGLLVGLPAGQIESILLHELAHIRRHDYLVNMLQTAVEGFFFYNPAVWWISGVMRAERENCCDDLAVAVNGNAREYAAALAQLEQNRWDARQAALAATGGNTMKRIRRLLSQPEGPRATLTPLFFAAILMITAVVGLAAWQAKSPAPQPKTILLTQAQPAPRSSPYTLWLEEDVAYIITDRERAAFVQLQTDPERVKFIEQFWARRNPTPGAPENEYRREHYRRIAYANEHFAPSSGTPGWKTDRGRIYITFGPPEERDGHPNGDATTTLPYERWRYLYINAIGNDVNMEFVDTTGSGDFRMTRDPSELQQQQQRVQRPRP
jgi:GWxTD domain-containing protein